MKRVRFHIVVLLSLLPLSLWAQENADYQDYARAAGADLPLWQPLVSLSAGEPLLLPAMAAEEGLVLVVEGLMADGTPVYYRKPF